jgi:hypothetical protein
MKVSPLAVMEKELTRNPGRGHHQQPAREHEQRNQRDSSQQRHKL